MSCAVMIRSSSQNDGGDQKNSTKNKKLTIEEIRQEMPFHREKFNPEHLDQSVAKLVRHRLIIARLSHKKVKYSITGDGLEFLSQQLKALDTCSTLMDSEDSLMSKAQNLGLVDLILAIIQVLRGEEYLHIRINMQCAIIYTCA